jgi:dihydrofolate synthase / folylpolyglutamate synthase
VTELPRTDPSDAYRALLARLDEVSRREPGWSRARNLKLERMQLLVDQLGNPQLGYPAVHVAGTSGKGTVATMTAAVLTAHGRWTGLHLSPFVETLTESWQLDGAYVDPVRMLRVLDRVLAAAEAIAPAIGGARPTYFETKVAAAFELFAQEAVDVAVVEVGLGGALDATNVLGPGVKVLTNVGLDHTEILGDTIEEICADKLGILRSGSVLVSGVHQPTAIDLVRARARELGVTALVLGSELKSSVPARGRLELGLPGSERLSLAVPGSWPPFQYENAALAVAAAGELLPALEPERLEAALAAVRLPGRLEELADAGRAVLLDGAHNAEKLRTTVEYVRGAYAGRRVVAVLALKDTKSIEAVAGDLGGLAEAIVVTSFTAEPWRAHPPAALAEQLIALGFAGAIEQRDDPNDAFERALELTRPGDMIVVTGSLYLAGNLRPRWFPVAGEVAGGASYRL